MPAYTQSTQLRTLISECQKNKIVLNREKCNKNMPHPGTEVYRFCNNPEPKQKDFDCFSLLFWKQLSQCLGSENAGEATI